MSEKINLPTEADKAAWELLWDLREQAEAAYAQGKFHAIERILDHAKAAHEGLTWERKVNRDNAQQDDEDIFAGYKYQQGDVVVTVVYALRYRRAWVNMLYEGIEYGGRKLV